MNIPPQYFSAARGIFACNFCPVFATLCNRHHLSYLFSWRKGLSILLLKVVLSLAAVSASLQVLILAVPFLYRWFSATSLLAVPSYVCLRVSMILGFLSGDILKTRSYHSYRLCLICSSIDLVPDLSPYSYY